MKFWMQVLLVVLHVITTMRMLYVDCNGRPAKAPEGFVGVVGTLISLAVTGIILYGCGCFSELIGG